MRSLTIRFFILLGLFFPALAAAVTPMIAAGGYHTCALTSAGAVQCWGNNGSSQLGNGTTTNSTTPVAVTGLSSGVVSIAGGGGHTCAVTSAGAVQCWGNNGSSQLGNGTNTASTTPVAVTGLSSGVVAISAGMYHTCAVTSAGAMLCWGRNTEGQFGNGTNTASATPVAVTGLTSGVISIAAGLYYTCALTSVGAVQCWGSNSAGQLGNGYTGYEAMPVAVTGLSSGVASIAAGWIDTCAVTNTGALLCWGGNSYGELGNGGRTTSTTPVAVTGLSSGVISVAVGYSHTCALTSAGAVKCWGYNVFGQLGNSTTADSTTPVAATGLSSDVVAIAAGGYHTCALTSAGAVLCWGYNLQGELGYGTFTNSTTPVQTLGVGGIGFLNLGTGSPITTNAGLLTNIQQKTLAQLPSLANMPSGFSFGNDFVSFTIFNIIPGASVQVVLTLPALAPGDVAYWVNSTGFHQIPGAVFDYTAKTVTFTVTDGGFGDTDGLANGIIVDPVGVGTPTPSAKISQTISFGTAPTVVVGGTGTVSATGGASGNVVTFTSSTAGICTVSGSTVTGVAAGTCTIAANQAGDANYNAATQVTQNITVGITLTAVSLVPSWNLVGNSINAPLDVAATLGDTTKVTTVWKWIPATSKWAFYTPSMTAPNLATYAAGKGYDVLTTINGGEGFWVNAKAAFTVQLPTGSAITTSYFQNQTDSTQNKLSHGWNLIATGDNVTPSVFNLGLSVTLPAPGTIPLNVTTLWAWDSALSNWYFYAPSLEASGGLANYITSKGYLNFGTKPLDPTMGFWVNKP